MWRMASTSEICRLLCVRTMGTAATLDIQRVARASQQRLVECDLNTEDPGHPRASRCRICHRNNRDWIDCALVCQTTECKRDLGCQPLLRGVGFSFTLLPFGIMQTLRFLPSVKCRQRSSTRSRARQASGSQLCSARYLACQAGYGLILVRRYRSSA